MKIILPYVSFINTNQSYKNKTPQEHLFYLILAIDSKYSGPVYRVFSEMLTFVMMCQCFRVEPNLLNMKRLQKFVGDIFTHKALA